MKRDERREAAREAATVARQQSLSHEALSKALQVVKFRDWFRAETSGPDESLSPRADLVEVAVAEQMK
ncbi:unnamed protein product [Cladocopium goreaui]|uniref:Uncharacterized protein n=1 Tax=Cladocopium goreaui TaxID=2562237 RepID=A0A9P1D056_9DINO|nr:unnamed protein product [Cladocopium goreaui]